MRYGVDNLTKFSLVSSKLIFCALVILDVGIRSIPSDDPALWVAYRHRTKQKPPMLPIKASEASLLLPGLLRSEDA
ncbi:MAG: hypothetical protein AUH09_05645 [Candidatus Rokubacteria bacterium 13_2_20CM_70_12]|nr:MAG: hypothetical protein AUH09_05645 [Candidatus Rokubacteria bacterium 13_2_20CM_70_12]